MENIPLDEHFVSIDEMLTYAGEFGRFQLIIQVLLCLMQFPPTFPSLIMYFAALNPTWKCASPGNNTYCNSTRIFPKTDSSRCDMPRDAWVYTKHKHYSIVTQFDIHCSNHWIVYLTTSLCFAGMAFGSIVMGWLGDKYGRKRVLFPSSFLLCLFSLASSFVPNIELFLLLRFLVGFLRSGTSVFMILIASELTGSSYRPLAGSSLRIILPIANALLGVQAYYANSWSDLFIMCSAPYFFFVLFYKFVPESIRWLRLHGQSEEVEKVFRRMAKWNKKEIPQNIKLRPVPEHVKNAKTGVTELFKTGRRALSTLNLGFAWMVFSLLYFGVSLAADDLGGSLYGNFILISLVEFPAGFAAIYLLNKIGRKKTIICTMFLGSAGCIGLSFTPTVGKIKILRVTLGAISKFFITIGYNSIYTWTVEIFPTTVRAAGMGFTQFNSRAGAVIAPFAAKGLKHLHPIAPFLFMGLLGVVATSLLAFLHETRGKPTKETISRPHRPTEIVANDHTNDK